MQCGTPFGEGGAVDPEAAGDSDQRLRSPRSLGGMGSVQEELVEDCPDCIVQRNRSAGLCDRCGTTFGSGQPAARSRSPRRRRVAEAVGATEEFTSELAPMRVILNVDEHPELCQLAFELMRSRMKKEPQDNAARGANDTGAEGAEPGAADDPRQQVCSPMQRKVLSDILQACKCMHRLDPALGDSALREWEQKLDWYDI